MKEKKTAMFAAHLRVKQRHFIPGSEEKFFSYFKRKEEKKERSVSEQKETL